MRIGQPRQSKGMSHSPANTGKVTKEVEMKLDIQWWATTNQAIVGLIPLDGKTVVIKSDHNGDFTGYQADEVSLQHLSIEGDEFRLYATCKKGNRVEDIRLFNPIFMNLLGTDPNEIIRNTTFI